MSGVFNLPDLGEGLTEAEIVEWHVAEGDEVAVDQTVVTVETAKATVDVPCPYAGRVETLHGAVGETVAVGSPLVTVGAGSDSEATVLAGERQYREEEMAGATAPADEGSGAVLIGYGTGGATTRTRRRRVVRPAGGAPMSATSRPSASAAHVRVISPIVRRLAREHGINLAALPAARDGAVVRRADVEAAARTSVAGSPVTSPGLDTASAGAPAYSTSDPVGTERIPLTGIRRTIADKVTQSRREIPDATTWVDADATELVAAKDALKTARPDAGIGVLALMARITIAALKQFPELNATIDGEAQEIVRHRAVHLGFAAQSPRGLVVPVVKDADQLSTTEVATALRDLTAQARAGELTPAQLTGSTFTLNNYGVFGVDGSTPIINHPEVAMLGVGRIIDRPWAHDGELALRKVTQLGLTFDHRACDGGSAGGFLRLVADSVERPVVMLADL
ncbi:dihydrolipoamide acetyltransferase family protein [Luteipulveratus halotolerans]|uniref:Dihydrolipoamide acetyltransferase component of pyruvate dehydrogenase complex n=1 Tax=Luteipulveratus halotolerans TaxID=1631356 RepID=A0A0L6CKZ8_9MICO|nr:dihydrolipoamide acetyltransferase family protein [Luteipulveratus halotolerans]KNX38451.1 branched-chain alpha-keto acid dehydrogenase subunit E2 [Luteipulveratus halotolerans]